MIPIMSCSDFYKADHRRQYPEGTEEIYSNFTPRTSRIPQVKSVVFFGLQYFIKKYLLDEFDRTFFKLPKQAACISYKRRLDTSLGQGAVPIEHVEELHDLGFLPLIIKALPEGSLVPLQCPMFTVWNTKKEFYWLTNWAETLVSATVWGPCTSATTAFEYRKVFESFRQLTGGPDWLTKWQGHDFSFRGMMGVEAACMSAAGHLLSFTGTDTIPAIDWLELYYNADSSKELVGGSVPATEHSVQCAGGKEDEAATYKRLITEVYPKGIVSIVSDTWDFWHVVTSIIPSLKAEIMAREGKVVIRPDSGDPVKIIAGDDSAPVGSPEFKGLIECLWDTFGGTLSDSGYKMLDTHIGAIYGDSITLERQMGILSKLAHKGFASSNVVLGIGSYTYQYVTRDTFGFAMKSTHAVINGKNVEIFKEPKTDSGKNSHKGLIKVVLKNGVYTPIFPVSREEEESEGNELKVVFKDGKLIVDTTLAEIRARIDEHVLVSLQLGTVS
jgi:nicotinamide phosphoribosyltransferase